MRLLMNRRIVARALLALTGAAAAVSLAACNGTATGALTINGPQTTTSVSSGSAQAAGTPATVTGSRGTPACKANMLTLGLGPGDAGMNQVVTILRLTNVSHQSCTMYGYPGVSYVAGSNGTQVGAAAARVGTAGVRFVLPPGQAASTVIHTVQVGVFDDSVCKPTAIRGYRVYPPGDTASLYISLGDGAQGCAGTPPQPQLEVHALKFGLGDLNNP